MEIHTQKEKHSCKSSELSLKRKEGITRKTEKIKANFRGIKKASLDNFHVYTFIYVWVRRFCFMIPNIISYMIQIKADDWNCPILHAIYIPSGYIDYSQCKWVFLKRSLCCSNVIAGNTIQLAMLYNEYRCMFKGVGH